MMSEDGGVFSICMSAVIRRSESVITATSSSALVMAVNFNEAMGKGVTMAYTKYPEKDGFYGHRAECWKVPDEWIIEAARILTPEKQK